MSELQLSDKAIKRMLKENPKPADWPQHNSYHRRTIMGNWLFDEDCLRCQLEAMYEEQAERKKK